MKSLLRTLALPLCTAIIGLYIGCSSPGQKPAAVVLESSDGQTAKPSRSSKKTPENEAQPSKLTVACSTPEEFNGMTPTIKGTLDLTPSGQGPLLASGKVSITIAGSTARPVLRDEALKVAGVYDKVINPRTKKVISESLIFRQDPETEGGVFVNLNWSEDIFFVEVSGKRFTAFCKPASFNPAP